MRDFFNDAGKINILIVVSLIVIVGFGCYLLSIGNMVKKAEKDRSKRF
jgi:hypothetical protein